MKIFDPTYATVWMLCGAQALGADAVMIGRAFVYALAARGEEGVAQLLDLFEKEMRVAMTLTGTQRLADIDRRLIAEGGP